MMPGVDHFMDEVVTGFRRRLALLSDGGDRRAIEDGIALLTHCLRSGMDEAQLETLLSTLRAGRFAGWSGGIEARYGRARADAPLAGVSIRSHGRGSILETGRRRAGRGCGRCGVVPSLVSSRDRDS